MSFSQNVRFVAGMGLNAFICSSLKYLVDSRPVTRPSFKDVVFGVVMGITITGIEKVYEKGGEKVTLKERVAIYPFSALFTSYLMQSMYPYRPAEIYSFYAPMQHVFLGSSVCLTCREFFKLN